MAGRVNNIYVALPAYTGAIEVLMAHSLLAEMLLFSQRGDGFFLQPICGFADLRYVKNLMLSLFLATDCTHFVVIDYDVAWPAGTLPKMVDYDQDFVCGVYPARKDPATTFQVNYLDNPNLVSDQTGELIKVASSPGGFWCIKREAIERMLEHYKELEFNEHRVPNGKCYDVFGHFLEDKVLYGEDVAFCKRWIAMGGTIWAKPDITFKHIGKKEFIGNFGEWLKGDRT